MRSRTPLVRASSSLLLLVLGGACGVDSRQVGSGSGLPPGGPSGPAQAQPGSSAAGEPGSANAAEMQAGGLGGPSVSASTGPRPLDLLFVIDNSISMADKQALLGQVGDVLSRFTQPLCVDDSGAQFFPATSINGCPAGQHAQFAPVTDVHLGVITTSMGDAGADVACPPEGEPRYVPDRVDNARLLGTLERGRVQGVNEAGFISWRTGDDEIATATSFAGLIRAAGENGCGWEMTLEAWYRFLVDPHPYAGLEHVDCPDGNYDRQDCVQPTTNADGSPAVDQTLLSQRAAFLRPNSRLGIVMLSDENDCSVVVGGKSWTSLAIDDARPFYRGSSACARNPNDPCCYSCALDAPVGCAEDPTCSDRDIDAGTQARRLPPAEDGQNLRCFHQKQRFGVDLLYPIARYVNALSQQQLCPAAPDLSIAGCAAPEENPLFSGGRTPSDVFLAGILGVPAQLIEAQADSPGRPPVADGYRYRIGSELSTADWNAMVGDSNASPPVPPTSPFMVESELERANITPGNTINGREHSTRDVSPAGGTPDDLEFSCILPLPSPRDCALADAATQACDCYAGSNDSPLCEQTPGQSAAGTVQYWGKAYPGTRQLEVLRGLGPRAVVGSICPRNTTTPGTADFAYRPSIAALVDSMAPSLATP